MRVRKRGEGWGGGGGREQGPGVGEGEKGGKGRESEGERCRYGQPLIFAFTSSLNSALCCRERFRLAAEDAEAQLEAVPQAVEDPGTVTALQQAMEGVMSAHRMGVFAEPALGRIFKEQMQKAVALAALHQGDLDLVRIIEKSLRLVHCLLARSSCMQHRADVIHVMH